MLRVRGGEPFRSVTAAERVAVIAPVTPAAIGSGAAGLSVRRDRFAGDRASERRRNDAPPAIEVLFGTYAVH